MGATGKEPSTAMLDSSGDALASLYEVIEGFDLISQGL